MSIFHRWLAPLRHGAAAFFRHDVTLKRERGQLHVVLAERKAPPAKGGRGDHGETERRRRHEETMLVRTELAALLNDLPETRTTMRHLVFVEQALAKKGLKVLHKVPLPVLKRAHEQLENLVINWSAVGLANLRSKMAVAIIDREHMDPDAEADAYRTAAVIDHGGGEPAATDLPELNELAALCEEGDSDADGADRGGAARQLPGDEDAALAAAYAALGEMAPATPETFDNQGAPRERFVVQLQGELGSASARALRALDSRSFEDEGDAPRISIRVLEP
ncbi:MAG: hypothetical protein JNL85_09595 [Rubrivivax sp.]|nr:hypothetical protein [Rubrivivax sp.]